MATCEVDTEPQSIFGVTCGLVLQDGKCPQHGEETTLDWMKKIEARRGKEPSKED